MPDKAAKVTPSVQVSEPDKDLLDLLALLDRPLDRRIIDRGYENLRAFLARPRKPNNHNS